MIERGLPDLRLLANKLVADVDKQPVVQKSKKKRVEYKKDYNIASPNYLIILLLAVTVVLGGMFVMTSASINYAGASSGGLKMNPDWKESLEWMRSNTPDPGVNYTQIYDIDTFTYPDTAYGVMSWWDYGHMITYIAHRIPNANPFQQGVVEDAGSADFFIATSEEQADIVMERAQTRFIITDIEMASGKFYAMTTWYNSSANVAPFQKYVIVQNGLNSYTNALLYTDQYYLTMIARLHNFDGSYREPSNVYYVEYTDPEIAQMAGPLVTVAQAMNYTNAHIALKKFNTYGGYHAMIASPVIMLPVEPVPALHHYRLIHESPTNIFNTPDVDLKYVKTFERVKGATIKGNGFIEVLIQTNTGRQFFYQQESVNGEFIVPYSTVGSPYDTKAMNKYRIIGTDRFYEVTEEDVMQGRAVE